MRKNWLHILSVYGIVNAGSHVTRGTDIKEGEESCVYRIALVEDEKVNADRFVSILNEYSRMENVEFRIQWYRNAITFLEEYNSQFDIVFMDIRMPVMDGMEAARELRRKDQTVLLVFLTALAQYAIQGYEVEAADYLLKPVSPTALRMKLKRLLPRCVGEKKGIMLVNNGEKVFVRQDDLLYAEIFDHHIQHHTAEGILRDYGTLKKVEQMLPPDVFYRVNNQTIVNLRRVSRADAETVYVDGRDFTVSMRRRKGLMEALHLVKTGR